MFFSKKSISGKKEKSFIYVCLSEKDFIDEKLKKVIVLTQNLSKIDEIIDSFSQNNGEFRFAKQYYKNILRNYIFNEKGIPTFKENKNYDYLKEKYANIPLCFEKIEKLLLKEYKILEDKKLSFSSNLSKKDHCIFSFEKMNMVKLNKGYNYDYSQEDYYKVNLFYFYLENLSKGDQWTLVSDNETDNLMKKGFNIECFGSSFNTRMKYFGSISEYDIPFGRIGDFEEIFKLAIAKKELKWKEEVVNDGKEILKMTVNPPGGKEILFKAVEYLNELLKIRNCHIFLYIPFSFEENVFEKLEEAKEFFVFRKLLTKAYHLSLNTEKNMVGREWSYYEFKKDGKENKKQNILSWKKAKEDFQKKKKEREK